MSATAIAVTEEGLMLRPSRRDGCVRRRAAELALPAVKSWMGCPDSESDESMIQTLMNVIGGPDGYQIAKDLDRAGWNSDAELVEAMDQGFIDDALEELTRQWVKCVGASLSFPIGAEVKAKYDERVGVVVHRDEVTAEYGVRYPGMPESSWCRYAAERLSLVEKEGEA